MSDNEQAGGSGAAKTAASQDNKQVLVQKIFTQDVSVEVPNAPGVFTLKWEPNIDLNIQSAVQSVREQVYLVSLTATVTAKVGDETAYLVEVKEGGIFELKGLSAGAETQTILGAYCPNLLFPYLRESVSSLITKAGFPPFLLQPVNFEALYREHAAQAAKEKAGQTKH